jgi:hypothetical protein
MCPFIPAEILVVAVLPLAFIGGLGYGELLIVGFIALMLFGQRLPQIRDRWFTRRYEADTKRQRRRAQLERRAGTILLIVGVCVCVIVFACGMWQFLTR